METLTKRNVTMDMREALPEFFEPGLSTEDFIRDGTIVLDSNVLLSLYRWSLSTRNEALDVLEGVQDRLWIPFQACREYLYNRASVAASLDGAYSRALSALEAEANALRKTVLQEFGDGRRYEDTRTAIAVELNRLTEPISDIRTGIEALREQDGSRVDPDDDPILERIIELTRGRFGMRPEPATERQRIEHFTDVRLPNKQPPGYMDRSKDRHGSAGDYLIWCEILDLAKERQSPILFVTDDTKDDWYAGRRGNRTGPRHELLEEMAQVSVAGYRQSRFDRFVGRAKELLNLDITAGAVAEIEQDTHVQQVRARVREAADEIRRSQGGGGGTVSDAPWRIASDLASLGLGQAPAIFAGSSALQKVLGGINPGIDFAAASPLSGSLERAAATWSDSYRQFGKEIVEATGISRWLRDQENSLVPFGGLAPKTSYGRYVHGWPEGLAEADDATAPDDDEETD